MAVRGSQAYDWDEGNTSHIATHGRASSEVEESLEDLNGIEHDATSIGDEERFGWIGMTRAGLLLFVVYTMRGHAVRPLSDRKATRREQLRYLRRR
jgi:uncharacterized DUF497 family protein